MTTVTWDDKYVFMENSEGKGKGTESVIDVSDPANPKEIVRFVPEESLDAAKAALEPKGITVKKMMGLEPQSDEISLDNKYAFVINRASKSVGVIDIATLEYVAEIPLTADGKPRTGDLSPDGSKLYVSVPEKNVVDVIDVATLTKVKSISGLSKPQGVIGAQVSAAHAIEAISAVKAEVADTEAELHELEESLADVKKTADAAKAEGKGVCGPTALLALAMLPLGIRRLLKRD
jgi:YVTN family beta-propeller protein